MLDSTKKPRIQILKPLHPQPDFGNALFDMAAYSSGNLKIQLRTRFQERLDFGKSATD
jgi:hypothetical protein